eukprot:scaffold183310_cov22-Prasinocladus_malaysianus.AAC.1
MSSQSNHHQHQTMTATTPLPPLCPGTPSGGSFPHDILTGEVRHDLPEAKPSPPSSRHVVVD